jgi:hypothetical protein
VVKDSGASVIVVLDARNWFYDYTNGIFFQQTASATPAPATIDLYVYIGNTVQGVIGGSDPFTQYIINDGSRGAQTTSQNLTFSSGVLLMPDGSFTNPSYAFKDNTDTGMTLVDPNILSLVMNGVRVFEIDDTGAATQVTFSIGSAAAPAFSFIVDKDTGWFRKTTNSLSGSTGGTEIVNWDASGVMSQYGDLDIYDQLSGGFKNFEFTTGTSTSTNQLTIYGDPPRLVFDQTTLDSGSRPAFFINNNNTFVVAGDDHANQSFTYFAGFSGTRTYDAIFRVYGKETSGFTKRLSFSHDGTDGYVVADAGQLYVQGANGFELRNSGGTAVMEFVDSQDKFAFDGAIASTVKYFFRGTLDENTAGLRAFNVNCTTQTNQNGAANAAIQGTLKPGITSSIKYNIISLATIDAHPTLGSNNITNLYINFFRTDTASGYSGNITNVYHFICSAPNLLGSGTITSWVGAQVNNVTSGSVTNARSFVSAMNSGTGRHGLYFTGTAQNYINGYLGIKVAAPSSPLHVDQSDAAGAVPVVVLDQGDIDDSFINFVGTSAADGTRSLSSSTATAGGKAGAIRIEINGTTRWLRFYDSAV